MTKNPCDTCSYDIKLTIGGRIRYKGNQHLKTICGDCDRKKDLANYKRTGAMTNDLIVNALAATAYELDGRRSETYNGMLYKYYKSNLKTLKSVARDFAVVASHISMFDYTVWLGYDEKPVKGILKFLTMMYEDPNKDRLGISENMVNQPGQTRSFFSLESHYNNCEGIGYSAKGDGYLIELWADEGRNFVDIKVTSDNKNSMFNYTFNFNGSSRIETCSGSKKGIIDLVNVVMDSTVNLVPDESVILF